MESLPVDKVNTIISKSLVSSSKLRLRVLRFHCFIIPFSNFIRFLLVFAFNSLLFFFPFPGKKSTEFRLCFKLNRSLKSVQRSGRRNCRSKLWKSAHFHKNLESMFIQYDNKKSRTVLLSSIQGFQSTYKRRTSTKDCYLLYTSSRTKPQKSEHWHRSKVSPGFSHEAVDCYIIVSRKPLKEPDCSDGTVRYSSIELYNFLKRGTLLMETAGNLPKRFKLVWRG